MKTGNAVLTPAETTLLRRANSSRDLGPGSSVTSRRSCGRSVDAGPVTVVEADVVGSVAVMVLLFSDRSPARQQPGRVGFAWSSRAGFSLLESVRSGNGPFWRTRVERMDTVAHSPRERPWH